MMPRDRDKDFTDPDFERVRDAYADMPQTEPPDLLDRAILNKARRTTTARSVRPWNFGWIHALSTAAILVLGVGLFMQQPEPAPQEPLRVAKPPSDKLRDVSKEFQPLRIPARPTDRTAASRAVKQEAKGDQERFSERRQAESANAAVEAAAPSAVAEETASPAVADAAVSVAAKAVAEQERDEPPGFADADEDPAKWLQHIQSLRAEGREEDFTRELAAFRKAWPDYPLPAELID